MLKLSLLTEDTNKSANRFEQKIVKMLYDIFEYEYTIDQIYYEPDVGGKIMDYLKDELVLPYEVALEIYFLFNNNLSKIDKGDDSWIENPVRGYQEEASAEQMVLAKHLQIPPNFLTVEHTYYGMSQFGNEEDGKLYSVGDADEVQEAVEIMAKDMLYTKNNSDALTDILHTEYTSIHGVDSLKNYIYIADWAIEEISREDANREIEDWYGGDPVDILNGISERRPDIEKEWEDLQGRRDDLEELMMDSDNPNQTDLLQDKIDEIDEMIEELAERATEDMTEEFFIKNAKWMKEDPLDWLAEFEYINSDHEIDRWGDYYDGYNRKEKKYPDWIRVDVEGLYMDLKTRINDYRNEEFARYDGEERIEDYNGETYYIYRTE